MADGAVRWWQTLTTVDADAIELSDPVVVLPVAAIEQHGPHLPLSTDLEIGLGLLSEAFRRLPDDFPAWALPPQAIGCSREHARFPGTLSLEPDQLSALIEATGEALAQIGVRRLVLSNSHGGNRHALETAGLRLRDELGMLVVHASWFRFPPPEDVELPEGEWRHGIHGGAVETAMMMHLRPDLVRMSEAARARLLRRGAGGDPTQGGSGGFGLILLACRRSQPRRSRWGRDPGRRRSGGTVRVALRGSPGGGNRGRAGVSLGPAGDGRPVSGSAKLAGRVG